MPQLNPAPWFMVFILVWMALIMFFTKIINTKHYQSIPQHKKQPNNYYWAWPWP